MNWKKSLSIVGTLIMVVGQNIAGVTAFAETISNQESIVEDIYFEKDNTKISEITLEQGKEETITFVDENKEDEEATVTLPESTKLNLSETNSQLDDASTVNYDQETNKVKIVFKNKEQNIKRTNLVLTTTDSVANNQERMYAKVVRQDSQIYTSKPVMITTTSSENNKQQEETQNTEEDGESAQQSSTNGESSNSLEINSLNKEQKNEVENSSDVGSSVEYDEQTANSVNKKEKSNLIENNSDKNTGNVSPKLYRTENYESIIYLNVVLKENSDKTNNRNVIVGFGYKNGSYTEKPILKIVPNLNGNKLEPFGDIGMTSNGELWGVTFSDTSTLYKIDINTGNVLDTIPLAQIKKANSLSGQGEKLIVGELSGNNFVINPLDKSIVPITKSIDKNSGDFLNIDNDQVFGITNSGVQILSTINNYSKKWGDMLENGNIVDSYGAAKIDNRIVVVNKNTQELLFSNVPFKDILSDGPGNINMISTKINVPKSADLDGEVWGATSLDESKPSSQIQLAKKVDKSNIKLGEELTYTITAKNSGNGDWNGTITDKIPTEYV
ncbi:DUF11 domain-containing protein, partial [Enterococcus faecalis]|nr:DUF11 domain-containing protein [Enterococcus faecalis]